MAQGLNVIPLSTIANVYAQKLVQDLRNLQVGRKGLKDTVAIIVRALEATGGNITDVATLFGITAAQAQVMNDEIRSFLGAADGIGASWDQANAVFGISV